MHKNRFNARRPDDTWTRPSFLLNSGTCVRADFYQGRGQSGSPALGIHGTLQMHGRVQQDQETIIIVPAGKRLLIETYTIHFF